jgi:hypothetical protein
MIVSRGSLLAMVVAAVVTVTLPKVIAVADVTVTHQFFNSAIVTKRYDRESDVDLFSIFCLLMIVYCDGGGLVVWKENHEKKTGRNIACIQQTIFHVPFIIALSHSSQNTITHFLCCSFTRSLVHSFTQVFFPTLTLSIRKETICIGS